MHLSLRLPALLLPLLLSACGGSSTTSGTNLADTNNVDTGAGITETSSQPTISFALTQSYLQISANVTNSNDTGQYLWSFGDGHEDSGASVSHSYSNAGSYAITLTEQNSGATASQSVSVNAPSAQRILPLGDSITHGASYLQSYRYPLWKKLLDAGVAVDYVGSLNTNHGGSPEFPDYLGQRFDPDHEGHYGWATGDICDSNSCNPLSSWQANYDADIVLLHLGTNNMLWDNRAQATVIEATFADLERIVSTLRQDNPSVKIALARLIPIRGIRPARDRYVVDFNSQVDAFAARLSNSQSPIVTVDHYSGFDSSYADDGVHPNASGEQFMAERWYSALEPWLN